tara:strand:- start:30033 stop:30584 length:552 start_codon:yes stop_codon:yes gene_type:complete
MKKFYAILFLALSLVPVSSFAKGGGGGWLLGIDFSYITSKAESTTSGVTGTGESTVSIYDLSLGNLMSSGLYIGALYSTRSDKSGSDPATSSNALGASIGFIGDSGFNIIASYILSATDGDYKKGTGYQIDLGWRHFISSSFYMGTKVAMRSLKYTENATLSSGFESLTYSTTIPYVVLGFGF